MSIILVLLSILAVLSTAAPVQADMYYRLSGKSNNTSVSDFSLVYLDGDSDAHFDPAVDPVISFTGVSIVGNLELGIAFSPATGTTCQFTDGSGTWGDPGWWGWTDAIYQFPPLSNYNWASNGTQWSYSQSPVPVPPSAFLLGSGLIPLAWLRRRKGRRKSPRRH